MDFGHFIGDAPQDMNRRYYGCEHAALMGLLSGPVPLGWMLHHNLKLLQRPTAAMWGYFSGIAYMFTAVCACVTSFYLAGALIYAGAFALLYYQIGAAAGALEKDADMAPFPFFSPLLELRLSWITVFCTGGAAIYFVFLLQQHVWADIPFLEDF